MRDTVKEKIVNGVIAFLLALVFGVSFIVARDASCGVIAVRERVTVLETKLEAQQATLQKIERNSELTGSDVRAILIRLGGSKAN